MIVRLTESEEASQHYHLLRKCGFTTIEAVRLIAEAIGVGSENLTYGGLKDEDGITEQLIALPIGATPDDVFRPTGWKLAKDAERFMTLRHYGFGREPLTIGGLEGNTFEVVLRNLDLASIEFFASQKKATTYFLNYYDVQRFGVPFGVKRTNHVGAALLGERWGDALSELINLGAPESAMASDWTGTPSDFFASLDSRTVSFYLASHASSIWNASLRSIVERVCPDEHFPVTVEGIRFSYLRSPTAALNVAAAAADLPAVRYSYSDGQFVEGRSTRASVVQASLSWTAPRPDSRMHGKHEVTLRFFLPSGSYATSAVRQLTMYQTDSGGQPKVEHHLGNQT